MTLYLELVKFKRQAQHLCSMTGVNFQWHLLDRTEQAKYYDMAKKEKELHAQLHPGWSARDNYASQNKAKKRKAESTLTMDLDKGRNVRRQGFGIRKAQYETILIVYVAFDSIRS